MSKSIGKESNHFISSETFSLKFNCNQLLYLIVTHSSITSNNVIPFSCILETVAFNAFEIVNRMSFRPTSTKKSNE